MKPLTLHRLSIALLTTMLLLACCVVKQQQAQIYAMRLNLEAGHPMGVPLSCLDKQSVREMELGRQLAREKQINAHMERWLNDAAQQPRHNQEAEPCGPNRIDCIRSLPRATHPTHSK